MIEGGGTASNTTIANGGTLVVSAGGLADPTTILGGGLEIISARGSDRGALLSGGKQDVYGNAGGLGCDDTPLTPPRLLVGLAVGGLEKKGQRTGKKRTGGLATGNPGPVSTRCPACTIMSHDQIFQSIACRGSG